MADPSTLASDLRLGVAELSNLAASDLTILWEQIDQPGQARDALMDTLPALVEVYGAGAAALAAEWYDDERARVGARGAFRAIPADLGAAGAFSLTAWATSTAVDTASLQVIVEGGLQRRIANYARETVMTSSVRDPAARGWQRVGAGECSSGFCDMLIGRGAVYRTERSATFGAHDHCKCSAVPAWSGLPVPVRPYRPSLRRISQAERDRLSGYLAENYPLP